MPVQIPHVDPIRQLARKLFDAIISQVPLVGGPYAAMLSVTHPSKIEQLQTEWQSNVTGAINEIELIVAQLLPEITISNTASAIGIWFSNISVYGRETSVEFTAIRDAFPDVTKLEIEDACGELEDIGLATLSGAVGHKIVLVRPTNRLFEVFDPVALEDSNPRVDAAHLARLILRSNATVGAQQIMDHFGWNIRRLNPAMGIVVSMIGEGRKSGELHPSIACRYVLPNPQERSALRRFANDVLGTSDG